MQPVRLGGEISVVPGSQVLSRVHYYKRDEVYFTTLLWQNNGRQNAPISRIVFSELYNIMVNKVTFVVFLGVGGNRPSPLDPVLHGQVCYVLVYCELGFLRTCSAMKQCIFNVVCHTIVIKVVCCEPICYERVLLWTRSCEHVCFERTLFNISIYCNQGRNQLLISGGAVFMHFHSMTSSCLFNRGTTFSQTVTDMFLSQRFRKWELISFKQDRN